MDNKMNHLTKTRPTGILDKHKFVIKFPRSRGDSGALYLQSAIAEPNAFPGGIYGRQRTVRNVDSKVLCNAMP